jgi:hypothetical protein
MILKQAAKRENDQAVEGTMVVPSDSVDLKEKLPWTKGR